MYLYSIRTCNSLPMLRVKSLVDFIEEIKGGWVALLNCKDEGQRNKRLLSSRQLLHITHLGLDASKWNLRKIPTDSQTAHRSSHWQPIIRKQIVYSHPKGKVTMIYFYILIILDYKVCSKCPPSASTQVTVG